YHLDRQTRSDGGASLPWVNRLAATKHALCSACPSMQALPRLARRDNGDGRSRCHREQVLVPAHPEVSASRHRRSEHPGIGLFPDADRKNGGGTGHHHVVLKDSEGQRDFRRRGPEPVPQDTFGFGKIHGTGQQLMLRQHEAKQVRAETACDEGGDQDIGVEKNLHDTAVNTSSSVRMPWASPRGRSARWAKLRPLHVHPCVTVALSAPHQETATSASRIQLSRIQRRASDWSSAAGVSPPPVSRKRAIVGRK